MASIVAGIEAEVFAAVTAHGPLQSRHEAYAVIKKELDEFWDLVKLDPCKPMRHPTKGHFMSAAEWKGEVATELQQTAATCIRAIYDLRLRDA